MWMFAFLHEFKQGYKCKEVIFKSMTIIQAPLCSSEQMDCINNISSVDTSGCLKPCSGLIVTSFTKTQEGRIMDNWLNVLEDYYIFKKVTPFPAEILGKKLFIISAAI